MRRFSFLALPFLLLTTPAFAVGTEDETPPTPTETTTVCEDTQIFDEEKQECVTAEEQSFNDTDRYDAVRELAYAGKFDRAEGIIATANRPDDPRFLNYRGFIARKSGQTEIALEFYRAALSVDPDYVLARSYMGMGLVEMGDLDGAAIQLAEIRSRAGADTWAYFALKSAIAKGPSSAY